MTSIHMLLITIVGIAFQLFCANYSATKIQDDVYAYSYIHTSLCYMGSSSPKTKYIGRRLCYYQCAASTATLRLQLVECGDIHPNPGPDNHEQHHECNPTDHLQRIQSVNSIKIQYDVNTLRSLNCKQFRVTPLVWTTISDLGIGRKRTKRSRKGGRCRRRLQIHSPLPADSVNEQEVSNSTNRPILP